MDYKDFEKIQDLVQSKNELIRAKDRVHGFANIRESYVFSHISNYLYDESQKKEEENEIAHVIVKHKEELYNLIKKICEEEEQEITKIIDDIDRKLDSIKISFGRETDGR